VLTKKRYNCLFQHASTQNKWTMQRAYVAICFFWWSGASFYFGSSFFSSFSIVRSWIGFEGGVVAIAQPIHAPIDSIAINAAETRSKHCS
jgi:hypothetical protein